MADAANEDARKTNKSETLTPSQGNDLTAPLSGPGYTKPIADLFQEVTVMFADKLGFTAWSSAREPCQVFFLFESIYNSFDKITKKMSVVEVESIGDSYVAELPNPTDDPTKFMARFAYKCDELFACCST